MLGRILPVGSNLVIRAICMGWFVAIYNTHRTYILYSILQRGLNFWFLIYMAVNWHFVYPHDLVAVIPAIPDAIIKWILLIVSQVP